MIRAFTGHRAGVAHAVPVEHLGTTPGSRQSLARLTPKMPADAPHGDVDAGPDTLLFGHVGQPLDVVGETHDDVDAEVAHQLDLAHAGCLHTRAGRDE